MNDSAEKRQRAGALRDANARGERIDLLEAFGHPHDGQAEAVAHGGFVAFRDSVTKPGIKGFASESGDEFGFGETGAEGGCFAVCEGCFVR